MSPAPPQRLPAHSAGFTLTELAVVLAIIALLIGGMMIPLSAQQDLRGRQDTDKVLADIREALLGFAIANGRLPCPATANVPSGTAGAGAEATAGAGAALACISAAGVLPWATLGLPEVDAWGNRFTYQVTANFARGVPQTAFGCAPATAPTAAAFSLCTPGDITVRNATLAAGGVTIASNVPALVVSHGKNGRGAFTQQGTQPNAAPAGSDEAENANADANFVSNTTIDDQLVWIAPSLLMNRMVTAGKLP